MPFKYEISSGQIRHNDAYLGTGWAGQGEFKSDPNSTDVPDRGPLPRGRYTIGRAYHHDHLGRVVMNLEPYHTNQMFHRADFRIQGASILNPETSSKGCMVQIRSVREAINVIA